MKHFNKALNYSFLLLKYRSRTKKEIVDRLREKDFSTVDINETIEYLNNHNYINDEDFALVFVKEKLARGFGKRKVYLDLVKLGIEPELIEDKLNSIDEQIYIEKIQEVARRKQARYRNTENKQAKVFRYLRQRGFSIDEINKAFNENR